MALVLSHILVPYFATEPVCHTCSNITLEPLNVNIMDNSKLLAVPIIETIKIEKKRDKKIFHTKQIFMKNNMKNNIKKNAVKIQKNYGNNNY